VGSALPERPNETEPSREWDTPDAKTETEPVSVVVVDDHDIFRRGLSTLLSQYGGLEVAGEASDGEKAVRLVTALAPDVVVMDLNLPGISGTEATRRLAANVPHTRVLVLTISANDRDVTEAVLAGASGYLLKDASIDEIVRGIRAAAAGESLISPPIATTLLERLRHAEGGAVTVDEHAELTKRELEVLRLMAAGRDNAEIAEALFISPQTVKNHVSNILRKLQLENRIQAAVLAVRKGIV
jgi:DNA-binding NarL/FixJ family response regulator